MCKPEFGAAMSGRGGFPVEYFSSRTLRQPKPVSYKEVLVSRYSELGSILKRRIALSFGIAALALAVVVPFSVRSASAAENVNLLETGSSLLYPLFNLWVPAFTKSHPDVKITTQSTGSGTGISQAVAGIAHIGASDAYMSDALVRMHSDMLNIPLAISVQMVNYNLPGLNKAQLKLSGPVLAGIYDGSIKMWNDQAIGKANPTVHLPAHAIIPIHRSDGSGDTFIFTQYLSFSTPSWANKFHYGTTISWAPVPGGLGAIGNPGMVTALKGSPYSIAYIGTSYQDQVQSAGLGIARLKNRNGNFVLPTAANAKEAADEMAPKTPANERISLIFAPGGNSYPIINYEYAIVKRRQRSAATAAAMREFFNWAISPTGGNAPNFMNRVHFVPLPASIAKLSAAQIAQIQ